MWGRGPRREPPVALDEPAPQLPAEAFESRPLPADDADAGESTLRAALSVLTTIGPPLTVITALMIYFGWARTREQGRLMGVDVSLFGYSTQDYVLRSISSLYLPLLALAAMTLVALAAHQWVVRALRRPGGSRRLTPVGRAALAFGLLLSLAAVVVASVGPVSPVWLPLATPLSLVVGTVVAAYGGWLVSASREGTDGAPRTPAWQATLRLLCLGAIVSLALFWAMSIYAGVVGRGYALQLEQQVVWLPQATAFSRTPLGIEAAGVVESRLGTGWDATYRTTGLRFLERSGGRIFLVHDGWTAQEGSIIVLPDNAEIRWQFSR